MTQAAAAQFAHAQPLELPLSQGTGPIFGREVAEVHAELWHEHADLYGQNVAPKVELALRVTDAELMVALRTRELYREQLAELMGGHRPRAHADARDGRSAGCVWRADGARTTAAVHVSVERYRRSGPCAPVRGGGSRAPRVGASSSGILEMTER